MNNTFMPLTERAIWKNDSITRRYKAEHVDILNFPENMKIHELANACTYTNSWDNPYAIELLKRSGYLTEYKNAVDDPEKRSVLNKAYAYFGIRMF